MNPGLPQNAPWVPSDQLVTPYQTIVLNPVSVGARPGRLAARRGRLLRAGVHPRPKGRGAQPIPTPTGACPKGWSQAGTTPWGSPVCVPPPTNHLPGHIDPWKYVYTPDREPNPMMTVVSNPSPLAWAGIAAGAAALAGGGYWLWRRRQAAQLENETGVSVNSDCTKLIVTDAQVGPAYLASFADAAMAALGDEPVSTLVFAAGYLETVAPQCGVSVDQNGVQGIDTWQKAAIMGGVALVIAGHLHESGQIEDDLFKLETEEIQAFWLEHGVDDPALIEEVFQLPPDAQASAGSMGTRQLGMYEQLLGGRAPNMGGLGWGLLGAVAGGLFGGLAGAGLGFTVGRARVIYRAKAQEGGLLWEQTVVRDPGLGMSTTSEGADVGNYLGIVMGFPLGTQLDETGFPQNRATEAIWMSAFRTREEAQKWVEYLPHLLSTEDQGGRMANVGILGWGLLGLGAVAAGSGGYLWWRNRKLTQACLGATQWLTDDKSSLTPETETALSAAMDAASAHGITDPFKLADAAVTAVSGNEACRLPKLIWGDLLRVRALAIALAAKRAGGTPGTPREPGLPISPEESGVEANATCTQLIVHDVTLAQASFDAFLAEAGVTPDMTWTPNTIMLGATYLERAVPECGIGVSKVGTPDILGVDTWQKAAMVGSLALIVAGDLHDWGVYTDEAFTQETLRIHDWLVAHGVDDLSMLEDVISMPSITPGEKTPSEPGLQTGNKDDWGEPLANTMVDNGSVGGEKGGLWRVYQDTTGEFDNQYYFVLWRKGSYYRGGSYAQSDQARDAALQALAAGVLGNPTPMDRVIGVLTGVPYAKGMGTLASRMRARNGRKDVSAHFPMQVRFNNPLPSWCPAGSRSHYYKGKRWCVDPETGGWICAEPSGQCVEPKPGGKSWFGRLTARKPSKLVRRARARNGGFGMTFPTKRARNAKSRMVPTRLPNCPIC